MVVLVRSTANLSFELKKIPFTCVDVDVLFDSESSLEIADGIDNSRSRSLAAGVLGDSNINLCVSPISVDC